MENGKVNRGRHLKRLGFAEKIAINAIIYVSNIYVYAKLNSGVFRSVADSTDRFVASVCGNLKGAPSRILFVIDDKVDKGLNKFTEHTPDSAMWAINKAQVMTQKTSSGAHTFVQKAQTQGPSAAICYLSQNFAQLLLTLFANFWYLLNKITALHVAIQMALPTAAQLAETYNKTITEKEAKGNVVFRYVPLVPIEEIIKAYKQVEAERGPVCTLCNKGE